MLKHTLSDVPVGFSGIVSALEGDLLLLERLSEIGFMPGVSLKLKGKITFGEPLIVEMNDTTFAIKNIEARCIVVNRVDASLDQSFAKGVHNI